MRGLLPVKDEPPEQSTPLLELPPSPPPLPLLAESIVPVAGCENLNPVPPLSALGLFAPVMLKSEVPEPEPEPENLHPSACEEVLVRDEIPSEHDNGAPIQPPSVKYHADNLPLEEDTREETADILSCEIVPPANQITSVPPFKETRTMWEMPELGCEVQIHVQRRPRTKRKPRTVKKHQTMPKTSDQLTDTSQPDTDKSPNREIELEASQIDTTEGDDEVSDRSATKMAPPESDTRDCQTPAPPKTKTRDTPVRNMIPVSVYTGGEVQFNQMGAEYSIPPKFTFVGTQQTTFKDVRREIYNWLKLSEDHFSLNIQAWYNAVPTGSFFFTILAINDDKAWRMIYEMAVSGMNWCIIELYVKSRPNEKSRNANPNLSSLCGTSSMPQWSTPMHATTSPTVSPNYPFQPRFSKPPQVPNQTHQNYKSNPSRSPGTRSVGQQFLPMHANPSQTMPHNAPVRGTCSRPNPILSSSPSMSRRTQHNKHKRANHSQTKQYSSPLQGSSTRPLVPSDPNSSRHSTSSMAQRCMPMHANSSQIIPHSVFSKSFHPTGQRMDPPTTGNFRDQTGSLVEQMAYLSTGFVFLQEQLQKIHNAQAQNSRILQDLKDFNHILSINWKRQHHEWYVPPVMVDVDIGKHDGGDEEMEDMEGNEEEAD